MAAAAAAAAAVGQEAARHDQLSAVDGSFVAGAVDVGKRAADTAAPVAAGGPVQPVAAGLQSGAVQDAAGGASADVVLLAGTPCCCHWSCWVLS